MVPMVYESNGTGNQSTMSTLEDGSVAVQVAGVEMGQGLYTKVSEAETYSLSPSCSKVEVLKILNKIQILPSDSLHLPNTFCDAGSTTSTAACTATQQACAVLVQGLLPLREELAQAQPDGEILWEDLCFSAKMGHMELQSHEI